MKKKYFLVALAVLACALNSFAGDQKYNWHYVEAESYPTAKGTVYISNDITEENPLDYSLFSDYAEYKFKKHSTTTSDNCQFYSLPAEGYVTAGWTFIDPETSSIADTLISFDQNPVFSVVAHITTDDDGSLSADGNYPVFADTTFVAVFGKVCFNYIPGQKDYLGTVKMDNPANDEGDQVTITATPAEGCTFAYWTDESGNKVTENPYTFTVGAAPKTFTPMFESELAVTYHFPEEGKFIAYSNPKYVTRLVDNVTEMHDVKFECWEKGKEAIQTKQTVYQIQHDWGCLLWGKGTFTLRLDPNTQYDGEHTGSYFKPSGAAGTNIAELPQTGVRYYVYDGQKSFKHVTEGTVAPNESYLAIPDSVGETREIIPFRTSHDTDDESTGILQVENDKLPTLRSGIYDLNGRKMALPGRGVYIVDGKKKLFNKE